MRKSTPERYGTVAIALHWVSALVLVGALVSGYRAALTLDAAAKAGLLRVHVVLAIVAAALTLLRLVWWWRFDRRPAPAPAPPWQMRAGRMVHALFYVVILGMAASGIGMMVLSGAGPVLFGPGGVLPDFWQFLPRRPHWLGARVLAALVVLHAGAALYHHLVLRDGLLARIGIGRRA